MPWSIRACRRVGLEGLIQDWLGNTDIVMITLFVIISWKYFGFHMILLLAGLQGIPREIEEAALIDGAGRWQAFRYVTLPLDRTRRSACRSSCRSSARSSCSTSSGS